jgi:hypothetical protein
MVRWLYKNPAEHTVLWTEMNAKRGGRGGAIPLHAVEEAPTWVGQFTNEERRSFPQYDLL